MAKKQAKRKQSSTTNFSLHTGPFDIFTQSFIEIEKKIEKEMKEEGARLSYMNTSNPKPERRTRHLRSTTPSR